MNEIVMSCKNQQELFIHLKSAGSTGYNASIKSDKIIIPKFINNFKTYCNQYNANIHIINTHSKYSLSLNGIRRINNKITNHNRYAHLNNYIPDTINVNEINYLHLTYRIIDIIVRYKPNQKRNYILIVNYTEQDTPIWYRDLINNIVTSTRHCLTGLIFIVK